MMWDGSAHGSNLKTHPNAVVHGRHANVQARRRPADGVATAPGELGLKTARMLINGQLGASVFSAAYAAHILLGGKDFYLSYSTVPFAVWLFAELVKAGAGGVRVQDVNYVPAESTATGRQWVSQVDEYRWRPRALQRLSPYVYAMTYTVVPQDKHFRAQQPASGAFDDDGEGDGCDDDDGDGEALLALVRGPASGACQQGRLPLHPDHPFASTHMARRYRHCVVPQLIGDAPARPGDGEDVTDDQEAYAAFVLGESGRHATVRNVQ